MVSSAGSASGQYTVLTRTDAVFRRVSSHPALRVGVTGMLSIVGERTFLTVLCTGQLFNFRWQVPLAGRRSLDDDVSDHRAGCMVRTILSGSDRSNLRRFYPVKDDPSKGNPA